MSDIIRKIVDGLEQNFSFMLSQDYVIEPIEVYNADDENGLFARLAFKNSSINRKLTFVIKPQIPTTIDIYVTDVLVKKSMDLIDYIEFKKGNPLSNTQPFVIETTDITRSVDMISADIRLLIENDLKDVVFNHEWITFPTYDPRDNY